LVWQQNEVRATQKNKTDPNGSLIRSINLVPSLALCQIARHTGRFKDFHIVASADKQLIRCPSFLKRHAIVKSAGGFGADFKPADCVPSLEIGARDVALLHMSFHELATDATKYRTLSIPFRRPR
jgi:hypothetical protein